MAAVPLDFLVAITPGVLFVVLKIVDLLKPKPAKNQRRRRQKSGSGPK